MEKLADNNQSNATNYYYPWFSGTWTNNSFTNYETNIAGHINNDTPGTNSAVKQTYAWIADKNSIDSIQLAAIRYIDNGNGTTKLLVNEKIAWMTLDFKLTITSEMNSNLAVGTQIDRKPPLSARISDLYEKNGNLYILSCG